MNLSAAAAVCLLGASLTACASAGAEMTRSAALAGSTQPRPGRDPEVRLPSVDRRTLSNGIEVWVVEQHQVPVVVTRLVVKKGAGAESPREAGLAALTSAMLDEGTNTRSALQLADELDYLGAALGISSGYDSSIANLNTLRRTLPQALELYADVILNPSFPEHELTRVRQEQLNAIRSGRDFPGNLATDELARRLYGGDHPYGRPLNGTEATVAGLGVDDVRTFYRAHYRPENATIVVVGAVSTNEILPMLESAFGGWRPGPEGGALHRAEPPATGATRMYLIDKPAAPQTVLRLGHMGPARNSPDYFPLLLLNTVLGGPFSSRVNLKLREEKGYTYGAWTEFTSRRESGPFQASAAVHTEVTKDAVEALMKEMQDIRNERPVSEAELETAKMTLLRREPLNLQTIAQLQARYQDMVQYDLPPDYYETFAQRVRAVTLDEVRRVARDHLRPNGMVIVVVGDRSRIEEPLRALPYPLEVVAP